MNIQIQSISKCSPILQQIAQNQNFKQAFSTNPKMAQKFALFLNILILFIAAQEPATSNKLVGQENQISFFRQFISFALLALLVGLSQAGGIGGGPIISPVMMVLLGIESRKAVWNTYIMLLGGSIGNFIKLGGERVKSSGSPLINYKLVLVTLPLLLAGAVFGVATGRALPKIVIAVLLFLVLLQVLNRTYRSYCKLRKQEIERSLNQLKPRESWIELIYFEDSPDTMNAYTIKQEKIKEPSQVDFKKTIRADQLQLTSLTTSLIYSNQKLIQIYENEKTLFPIKYILHLILQVILVIAISILKGTKILPSAIGIEFCTIPYHIMNLLILVIGFISIYFYRKMMLEDEKMKEQLGYDFEREAKISIFIDETVKASLIAGFLGGLVGLGGGVILTPLWLELGIPSQRAAASATFCVFFTAFISVFSIFIVGGYEIQEIILFGLVSSIGSYIISGYLKQLVVKYQRESILVQVLLGVIAFGLLVLLFNSYQDIKMNLEDSLQFGRFC